MIHKMWIDGEIEKLPDSFVVRIVMKQSTKAPHLQQDDQKKVSHKPNQVSRELAMKGKPDEVFDFFKYFNVPDPYPDLCGGRMNRRLFSNPLKGNFGRMHSIRERFPRDHILAFFPVGGHFFQFFFLFLILVLFKLYFKKGKCVKIYIFFKSNRK